MKEKIMYDSPEAAVYETRQLTGWWSRYGRYFGESESCARYDGSTHRVCEECGNINEFRRRICFACESKHDREKWEKLEHVEWDGITPLCLYNDDKFFFSEDDIENYCEENEVSSSDLMLVICIPVYGREFDADDFSDELPEDGDLPDLVAEALKVFNKVVRDAGPFSWREGKQRTSYKRKD